jgi:hypothetical protein
MQVQQDSPIDIKAEDEPVVVEAVTQSVLNC